MTPRSALLIVNPSAGGGRAATVLPAVEQALRDAGWALRTEATRDLDDADRLAASVLTTGEVCFALGGDGLLGRVAGVLAGTTGVLGPLPGGRGNDFVRSLGLSNDPVEVVGVLSTAQPRRVDVGEVVAADGTATVYLGIASAGFDSDVQVVANSTTVVRGQLVYVYAALRTVASWRPARFTLSVDGVPQQVTGWSVAVANSGFYGGGMHLAPDARLDDGELDLVTTSETSRLRFVRSFPLVFKGTHVTRPSVQVSRVRAVTLDADRPFMVYADGDPVAPLPVTLRVSPGALLVLAP